jgi:hypothetical protein
MAAAVVVASLDNKARVCKGWIVGRQEQVKKRRRRPLYIHNGKNMVHVAHWTQQPTQRLDFQFTLTMWSG